MILFLLFFLYQSWAMAQSPTIDQLWFHQNPLGPETGLLKTSLPTGDGKEILISIIGSGVDRSHPFLQDILSSAKQDSVEMIDHTGEGTHVAGIIASFAKFSPSQAFKKIKIAPFKVDPENPLEVQILKAIEFSISIKSNMILFNQDWKHADVTSKMKVAFEKAQKQGMIFIASAGSLASDSATFPCSHRGVICVGSLEKSGARSSFSHFGSSIDVYAPGSLIMSTIPLAMKSKSSAGKGLEIRSGTHQASAIVAVYVAALMSNHSKISFDEVFHRLTLSAKNKFPTVDTILRPPASDYPYLSFKDTLASPVIGGSTILSFEIKNLGHHANRLTLTYSIDGTDYKPGRLSEVMTFKTGEASKVVNLPILVKNPLADRRLHVKVGLNYLGSNIVSDLRSDLYLADAGVISTTLHSGLGGFGQILSGTQESYLSLVDSSNVLSLYRLSNFEKLGSVYLAPNEKILPGYLRIIDRDDDGVDDLFMVSSVNGVRRLSFMDLNLKIKISGDWNSDLPLAKNDHLHFLSYPFENGKIKVPVFMATGSISSIDVAPGDFSIVDPDKHLYWLEPSRANGLLSFSTRTLTHEGFREKVLSSLSVATTSLIDLMVVSKRSDLIQIIGGIKDPDGITQSGLSIEISTLGSLPKVKSIGFDHPLDKNGLLLPMESSRGFTTDGDFLFVSAPTENHLSLYDIFNFPNGGHRMSLVGDVTTTELDEFIDIPFAFKNDSGIETWMRSLAGLQIQNSDKTFMRFPLDEKDEIQKIVGSQSFVLNHAESIGFGMSLVRKEGEELKSPLKYALAPKGCMYLGLDKSSLIFACGSGSVTKIMKMALP
jgi:hypothetical protein